MSGLLHLREKIIRHINILLLVYLTLLLSSCDGRPWNNPYPAVDDGKNILYSVFLQRPKHLDPARSYSEEEYVIHGQVYEPPLQYHYLKRPYQLEPLTAVSIPVPVYQDKVGHVLPDNAEPDQIAYTLYDIHIKPGILYQPHPAFARNKAGEFVYQSLTESDLEHVKILSDFKNRGTRELIARDYVYEIKRLAHPGVNSPIFSLMADYIDGLKEYGDLLKKRYQEKKKAAGDGAVYLDLERYPLSGVKVVDRYTYQIRIKGKYPQILYWLAMPFFAPVAPEVDRFYSQNGMKERNLNLDWYPVGTGAYMLEENNPNRRMVLEKNPNFRADYYPSSGEAGDRQAGLLDDAGKRMPFIDKVIYILEKESIPYWNKFLQGYYDASGISSDSFDQAIQFVGSGEASLTEEMKKKRIKLLTAVETSIFYMGFNMLDKVVGGQNERARKLRQAISIAVDYDDYISIFRNGRGIASQGPIPPGIFGYLEGKKGHNPVTYKWENGKLKRRSLAEARRLLAEAGYPDGRDAKTGKPLLLHFDSAGSGPGEKAVWDWYKKQFSKIDIQLEVRNTDYNRFRSKMRDGNAQIFSWGWNADYPDPENFLFLLYGPNGKVKHHGENAANYDNPEFNKLFEKMKNMDNGSDRQKLIDQMVAIVRYEAPWIWGFHPKKFVLYHSWYLNAKLNLMAQNSLKYKKLDPGKRLAKRRAWNKPVLWPVWLMLLVLILIIIPAVIAYMKKERRSMNMRA